MKLDGNNIIDYNNIPTSKPKSVSLNGIIYDARNPFWELEEGNETSKLVNAVEIAWDGAMVDELMVPQNITLADGIEYTVFTAMAKSKTIDYIIK